MATIAQGIRSTRHWRRLIPGRNATAKKAVLSTTKNPASPKVMPFDQKMAGTKTTHIRRQPMTTTAWWARFRLSVFSFFMVQRRLSCGLPLKSLQHGAACVLTWPQVNEVAVSVVRTAVVRKLGKASTKYARNISARRHSKPRQRL